MAGAFECDQCGKLYKDGFKGHWKKTIIDGKNEFHVEMTVSKKPHRCKNCWPKFCKLLYEDLRATYKGEK